MLTPIKGGSIRAYATLNQLLVLANMESYNAILINQSIPQQERLVLIRDLLVKQLEATEKITLLGLKQLEAKND